MEILYKNNIGICFCFKFSSVESTINHSHDMISMTIITCVLFIIPKLARCKFHDEEILQSIMAILPVSLLVTVGRNEADK